MTFPKRVATAFAAAFMVAACGGEPAGTANQPSSIDKTAIAFGADSTPDESYLPILIALDSLKKQGYNVQPNVQLNGTDLVVQAVANNQLQFMASGVIQIGTAVDKKIPLVVVGTRQNNTWNLVTTKDITSCDQLNGKKVAIFSTGGTSTAYLNIYLAKNCPNAKLNTLVIADSTLRRQALENGQVVAAPLEGPDTVLITSGADASKFHVLANFAKEMPGVGRDVFTTNQSFLKDHPTIVRALLKAQVEAIRSLYKDPKSISALNSKYFKQYGDQGDAIGKFYLDNKMWCANGGLNPSDMDNQLKTFQDAKKIPASVSTANLVDDTQMKALLKEIGTSSATTC